MRTSFLVLLLAIGVRSISHQHGFLANSSRYVDGLNFQRLPPILQFALEKSIIEVACSATQKNVKVSWTKENNQTITSFSILETGSLYISQVKLSDEGNYRCLLTNKNNDTIASHSVSIKVVNSGNFWELSTSFNVTTVENSVVRLPCPVNHQDIPQPYGYQLLWTKFHRDLITNDRIIFLENGALIIKNTHVSDSGIYRCKAVFNTQHIESQSYTVEISPDVSVNIIKEPEENKVFLPPSPPLLILNTPMVVNAVEGHHAILECITNDPELEPYQWERVGEVAIRNNVEIVAGGSLYFKSVTHQDSGVYKCKSSATIRHELRPVRLIVLRPPEVNFPKSDSVVNGPHVRFNCTATGMPQPNVEILKDGLPLHNDFNYDITGPTIIMANTVSYGLHISYIWRKDEGTYQCVARNKAGVSSELLSLKIGDHPNVPLPRNVSVKKFTSSSIHYHWQPMNFHGENTESKGFIVYFFPTDRKGSINEVVLRNTNFEKEYTKLLPDKNYTFIIREFEIRQNSTSISEPIHIYQKTKAERPIGVPRVTSSLQRNSINVRWLPLSYKAAGGNITQQKIQWKKKEDITYSEKLLGATTKSFLITDIDPSAIYLIRVLLSTSAGYSLLQQNWTQVGVDNSISSTLNNWHNSVDIGMCLKSNKYSNILISWNHIPQLNDENLNIKIESNSEIRIFKVQAFVQRLLVEQLDGGCYNVHLTGDSENSRYVEVTEMICTMIPEKEVPSSKYRLYSSKVTSFSSNSIELTWMPNVYKYFIIEVSSVGFLSNPFEQADLSKHEIFYAHDQAPYQVFDKSVLIVTCQSTILTLLYPATTYRIQIIAANEHLKGKPSSALFVTTDEGVPSSPINYNAEVLTTSSVNVTWLPPTDMNGDLIHYEVSYSSDKAAWKTAVTSQDAHSVLLKGLLSNTYYDVRIVASTSAGSGQVLEGVIFIPAELKQSFSLHMIAVCVISVFVISASIVLTYLCTKMFRLRKASSYGERDNSSSNMFNDLSSTDRQKIHVDDHAMIESNSSPNSQQFSNKVDMVRLKTRTDYNHLGCKKYVPSNHKESSLILLQKNEQTR